MLNLLLHGLCLGAGSQLPLKGRRESDNKRRVMDCETLPDRLSFLELARKAEMDVIRGQMSGFAALNGLCPW